MKNNEIALTFGLHRTTLRNWEKSNNKGREFLFYLLKHLPNEYIEKMRINFESEKISQDILARK